MTNLYRSPLSVQKVIKKHLPKKFNSVLDPAVGDGALITCLPKSYKASVTCIDIIKERINQVEGLLLKKNYNLSCINSDFLKTNFKNSFDLILMNPPFLGKKSDFVYFKEKKMPIEIAFVFKAIEAAKENAKLIFVLPNTVISNDLYSWARAQLFDETEITHVYELDNFSFSGVESKFYILICTRKNSPKQKPIILIKKDRQKIKVSALNMRNTNRLDYQFWESRNSLEKFRDSYSGRTIHLDDIALISRGVYKSKDSCLHEIHITDNDGFHWTSRRKEILSDNVNAKYIARNGDILVRRVGRNCQKTFGLSSAIGGILSDCVMKITANYSKNSAAILLSLRIIATSFPYLIISGTGAQYISKERLKKLPIFLDIFEHLPFTSREYISAFKKRQGAKIHHFEELAIGIIEGENEKSNSKNAHMN